jgi:hypothetical protein
MMKKQKTRSSNLGSENEKATKHSAGWLTWKWVRKTMLTIVLSLLTSNISVFNVESWPAVRLTQETHFSIDSKTTITVGGDQ